LNRSKEIKRKKSNHKHSFFYNYTISKHREFKQQRTPKLVVDLLFKKKKKIEKSQKKFKKHTSKQKKILENKKNFQEFLPPLLRRKKKTRRALPISHKKKSKNLFCRSTQRNISV
jgi:hypothetical protein